MRRTQLYLDDDLWNALRAQARSSGTTISELARRAIRERYLGDRDKRKAAMTAIIGIRGDRKDMDNPEDYVRELRRGSRLDRLGKD